MTEVVDAVFVPIYVMAVSGELKKVSSDKICVARAFGVLSEF